MRIFQIIEATANGAVPLNQTWKRNLYEPLVDLGHDVFLFSADEGRLALATGSVKLRKEFTLRIVETFRREHERKPFDLIFAYLMDGMVDSQGIAELKRYSVPMCNFSCNNVHQFDLVSRLAPLWDFNLHAEKSAGEKFRAVGANPLWWPMASNPRHFRPFAIMRDVELSFVGANYGLRARFAQRLLDAGVGAHFYGPGWPWGARTPMRAVAKRWLYMLRTATAANVAEQARWSSMLAEQDIRRRLGSLYAPNLHDPVSDHEMIRLYSRSCLTLGILDVHDCHNASRQVLRHVHLREFEAPMCGALYLTGFSDELAEFFEPDKQVLMYRDLDELIDKARFYLLHPEVGERVREAGHQRALTEHTYHRRFEQLFRAIGLSRCQPTIQASSRL